MMSSRNAPCRVVIVGLGPCKVDSLVFAADDKSFWAYFAGESFQFTADKCSFSRTRCGTVAIVKNLSRRLLADFKKVYHNAVEFEVNCDLEVDC